MSISGSSSTGWCTPYRSTAAASASASFSCSNFGECTPITTSTSPYFSSNGRSSSSTCRQLMQQNVQKSAIRILPRRSASFSSRPPVLSHCRPRSSGARTRAVVPMPVSLPRPVDRAAVTRTTSVLGIVVAIVGSSAVRCSACRVAQLPTIKGQTPTHVPQPGCARDADITCGYDDGGATVVRDPAVGGTTSWPASGRAPGWCHHPAAPRGAASGRRTSPWRPPSRRS